MLIDDVKNYIRVADNEEDLQVSSLIESAQAYLTNAGVNQAESNPLYALAVKMLVSHWYDNREPVGMATKLAYGLGDIITQLKYCYGGDV